MRRYLIVAEDSKSALYYLQSFPHDKRLVEIVAEGGAGNTLGVVQKGMDMRDQAEREGNPFVHVYCVFDKDDFPEDSYHNAVVKAKLRNDVSAIWSNECFEIWYLLHFKYHQTAIGRGELRREVGKMLEKNYKKGDAAIYECLSTQTATALANARRLYDATCMRTDRPWMENPCTNVHECIQELLKLSEISGP